MTDTSGPAFPSPSGTRSAQPGMTLRDYFAGQALAGFLSCGFGLRNEGPGKAVLECDNAAGYAYTMADAMLKERDR